MLGFSMLTIVIHTMDWNKIAEKVMFCVVLQYLCSPAEI